MLHPVSPVRNGDRGNLSHAIDIVYEYMSGVLRCVMIIDSMIDVGGFDIYVVGPVVIILPLASQLCHS